MPMPPLKPKQEEHVTENVSSTFTQNKRCFIIMPFGKSGTPEYSRNWKIYDLMIKPVVEACGYRPIRADELEHMGNITRDIIELLHESDLVVADLSGHNANVFYELGVRHALYRAGTVPIIREGETLPFDIATYRAIFYSSELDGPQQFKGELKRRIKAFEKLHRKRPDNPVHDILGEKLRMPDLKNYILLTLHQEKINDLLKEKDALQRENERLKREQEAKNNQLKSITTEKETAEKTFFEEKSDLEKRIQELEEENKNFRPKPSKPPKSAKTKSRSSLQLRSDPIDNLSTEEVKKMLKERDLFDTFYNKQGKGLDHQYEVIEKEGKKLVVDHTTGLTWQQSGSSETMNYGNAKEYINQLDDNHFAGHDDWRLPTLEEAMSLMETEKKNGDLYISEVFDKTQRWIWTADKEGSSAAWVVYFDGGGCSTYHVDYNRSVRAVVR
jgi:hypothetical protein